MSVIGSNVLAGASGQSAGGGGGGGFAISRSLRFNSGDSAYLNRTPSATGNRKKWTWSGWIKRSNTGSGHTNDFFSCGVNIHNGGAGGAQANAYFDVDGTMQVYEYSGGYGYNYRTTQVFRDLSAWYHIVISLDTSNSTAGDRVKIYVNGDRVTSFSTSDAPALNFEGEINKGGVQHYISDTAAYFDGYLADVHFIDGQALAPTDFGETNTDNLWVPKAFAGTYGPLVNQSQTWSNAVTGNPYPNGQAGGADQGFDGNLSTYSQTQTAGGTLTFTPSGGLSYSQSVRLYGFGPVSGVDSQYKLNGGTYVPGIESTWITLATGSGTINTITAQWDNSANRCGWYAIEVDGKILVDSGVTVTDNSFHLDFADNSSNAALGTDTSGNSNTWTVNNLTATSRVYSNSITTTGYSGNWWPANPKTYIFDADTTNYGHANANGGAVTVTLTLNPTVTSTSSVTIYGGMQGAGTATVSINGGTAVALTAGSSNTTATVVNFSGEVSSIVITKTSTGAQGLLIYGFAIDGTRLTDGDLSSIDSLVDTPTNGDTASDTGAGGEITGCYATWNPLDKHSAVTLANGNLDISQSSSGFGKASIHVSSGKWYWEQTRTDTVASVAGIALSSVAPSATYLGGVSGTAGFNFLSGAVYSSSPITKVNSSNVGAQANGSVAGFALDCDNGTLKLYINGVLQTANHITFTPGTLVTPAFGTNGTAVAAYPTNFGQRAFAYAAPSGYKSLNTANLSSTIADGSLYFDTKLYTGNSSTNAITGLNMSPDFVWMKNRQDTYSHILSDTVRGAGKCLASDFNNAEYDQTNSITSFNSDGFTLGSFANVNYTGQSYVSWNWDAGSSNTTIAAGGLNSSSYNQSQTWSTYGTFTGTFSGSYDWEGVFSASMQYDAAGSMYLSTAPAKWTLTSSIPCNSSVKFYLYGNTSFTINQGLSDEVTQTSTGGNAFHYFTIPFSGNISNIQVNTTAQYLIRIYVDGAALIDAGITLGGTDVPNVPSIASTVRSSPESGFSIIKWDGDGSAGTVATGLSSVDFIITKCAGQQADWAVWTSAFSDPTSYLSLNSTSGSSLQPTVISGAPTGGVVPLGSNGNYNTNMIMYAMSAIPGYSAMGSYTGNNSTDGPFVYTGFRPAWVMVKGTGSSATYSWVIVDSTRSTYNPTDHALFPNSSNVENDLPGYGDRDFYIDLLSNGFKLRIDPTSINTDGGNYIYLAFASHPFASNGGLAR